VASSKRPSDPRAGSAGKEVAPERRVEFTADEIGGELVSLLSEGLYTNPLDALREYIQNSIDAHASRIHVSCGSKVLSIRDNGDGMDRDHLIRARRLAVSEKSIATNIGFRGIGIYAGFHICERMRIRTKTQGNFTEHTAEFNFSEMKKILAAERGSGSAARTPLTTLLTNHVEFWSREGHGLEDSQTVVELINVLPLYYAILSSRSLTEEYILNTIPVGFDPRSTVGDQVNADIRAAWPEYRPIQVILSYPAEGERAVVRKLPPDLDGPMSLDVKSPSGKKIAMIWGCRTTHRQMIGKTWPALREIQGFVYKVKGVTVGRRSDSMRAFSQGTLYNWWTGEIWVLNDLVVPNTGRDAFEYNNAWRELQLAVFNTLRDFERVTSIFQQTNRAKENLDLARAEYDRILEMSLKGILTPTELGAISIALAKVAEAERRLKRFEAKDPQIATVLSECRLLTDRLKQLMAGAESGDPPGTPARKRRKEPQPLPLPGGGDPTRVEEPTPKSLAEIISTIDLTDPAVAADVTNALIATIEDIIPQGGEAYRDISLAFESKLDELELI
jgi:Histidine kinase-, DNA gyrase B-, and HSP90-like ATPase